MEEVEAKDLKNLTSKKHDSDTWKQTCFNARKEQLAGGYVNTPVFNIHYNKWNREQKTA